MTTHPFSPRNLPLSLAATACTGLLLLLSVPAAGQNQFRQSAAIVPGQTLEVRGVNGWIRVEPGSAGQAEISAEKKGGRSNPDSVRVEVVPHPGGLTVCAVYPTPEGSREVNECKPGGGRMSTRDNDVKVNFTIRIPAGVKLAARTVNGTVTAAGLDADADVSTVNGSVKVATRGQVRARTVNGSIEAQMGDAQWSGERKFETVNGSIEVMLPASASTDLNAQTVNGAIHSDFSVSMLSTSRRHLRGTIGSGGRQLGLKTVNGDITVKRG